MSNIIPNYQTLLLSHEHHKHYLSILDKRDNAKMSMLDGNDNRRRIVADDNILIEGDTAYIPISGVLLNSSDGLCIKDWFTDYSFLHKQIQSAYNNEAVKRVVFNVDSPGGMSLGMDQIAYEIRELSLTKETIAIVNGLCCSAAYMLSANCNKIYATPGSMVGSIGTYGLIFDDKEYYAKMGVKIYSVGKPHGKTLGRDGQEITEEVIARYQESIDEGFESIVDVVSKYVSREKIMELDAKYFEVANSLEHGLIDGILTAEQTLNNTFPKEDDVSKETNTTPALSQADTDKAMSDAIQQGITEGVAQAMAEVAKQSAETPPPAKEDNPPPANTTLPNSNALGFTSGNDAFQNEETNPNSKSAEAIKTACAFYSKPTSATKEIHVKLGEDNAN